MLVTGKKRASRRSPGRLLPHQGVPAIKQFTARLIEGAPTPWLRPLHASLHPPGTSLVRTLEGHSHIVNGVAVSADGRRAVSASLSTLKVWDVETGQALLTLKGHTSSVTGVAVTADGRRAVSASEDETLKVGDLDNGAILTAFTCDDAVLACTLTGDDKLIAGDAGGHLHFLSLEEPKTRNPSQSFFQY